MMPNDPVGGGEVLDYWGQSSKQGLQWLDENVIKAFQMVPRIQLLLYGLILLLMVIFLFRIFKIKSIKREKGMMHELNYINKVKVRDARVIRANNALTRLTNVVQKSFFALPVSNVDYWQYNLQRADIRAPGGTRAMKAQEFNALVQLVTVLAVMVCVFIALTLNFMLGIMLGIIVVVFSSTLPMAMIRATVTAKDMEIKKNFCDYYLMIHYVLLASSTTPLSGIMKSFAKTTESKEMIKYIDTCINHIETHGEYEATKFIAKDYREIAIVGKLMRLIRQANEGGEVRMELIGFRDELLSEKKHAIAYEMEKLVGKAKRSFNLLMIILVQAVVSAMAIYFADLGVGLSMFGI